MERRPLVSIGGRLHELPAGDDLPPARTLDLEAAGASVVPDAVAIKVNGAWREIDWASFLALIGTAQPPSKHTVTVGGVVVTANGETVVVNEPGDVEGTAVTVDGELVTAGGEEVIASYG